MATDSLPRQHQHLYPAVAVPLPQGIPTEGPASHPDGPPREYPYERHSFPQQSSSTPPMNSPPRQSPVQDVYYPPATQQPYTQSSAPSSPTSSAIAAAAAAAVAVLAAAGSSAEGAASGGAGANHYPSSTGVPRLPPILQVEKQQVTTSATQLASASRRRNEAHFVCPVPGCGSTFTRRFNLRGVPAPASFLRALIHLPQGICDHTLKNALTCANGLDVRRASPGSTTASMCFLSISLGVSDSTRNRRHQALHAAKSQSNICQGCKKTFSRLDALNVSQIHHHPSGFANPFLLSFSDTVSISSFSRTATDPFLVRSDGGAECRAANPKFAASESEANSSAQGVSREQPQPLP